MLARRAVLAAVALTVLALVWLALDDITTGQQPSFVWEYVMVTVGVAVLPLLYVAWRKV